MKWVKATENQEDPLIDKARDPPRASCFIIETIEEKEAHPNRRKIPLGQNVMEGAGQHRVRLLKELKTPNNQSHPPRVQIKRQRGR